MPNVPNIRKSEQTLQIIGHVVAEFYANKRSNSCAFYDNGEN
jgi:hypothetical protein